MTKLRFAPVSGAQSAALRIAAGWFIINGAVLALVVAAGLTAVLLRKTSLDGYYAVAGVLITSTVAAGSIGAGLLLLRGKRAGAYLGLVLVVLSPASRLIQGMPASTMDVVFSVVGIAVLFSIWVELN